MKTPKRIMLLIFAATLLTVFILTITSALASNVSVSQGKTPIDPYKVMLKHYENAINSDKTSKEEKELLKKKYASASYDATLRADAIKNEKPGAGATLMFTTMTPHPPIIENQVPDGIDNNPVIPDQFAFPKDFYPINGWHKKINESTLFIYAGFVISNRFKGWCT